MSIVSVSRFGELSIRVEVDRLEAEKQSFPIVKWKDRHIITSKTKLVLKGKNRQTDGNCRGHLAKNKQKQKKMHMKIIVEARMPLYK